MWQGPYPYDGYDTTVRMCAGCGAHIRECMGSLHVRDSMPLNEKPKRFPRELCFNCATARCHWDGDNLVRVHGTHWQWDETGRLARVGL